MWDCTIDLLFKTCMLHSYAIPELELSVFPLYFASPKDYRFDKWKSMSVKVARAFRQSCYPEVYDKMSECGDCLSFGYDSSLGRLVLTSAYFCRNRLCPQCGWRRRLFWGERLSKAFSRLVAERPEVRFLFLTLACRNCEVGELGKTIKQLSSAWRILIGSSRSSIGKYWPGLGYLRVLEVTREICGDGSSRCHPHIHACVPVLESYFLDGEEYIVQNSEDPKQVEKNYAGGPGWVQLWQKAMKLDYQPTAHVKSVESLDAGVLKRNLRQTLKYVVKPSSLVVPVPYYSWNVRFIEEIYPQLSGIKMVASGGIVREYLRKVMDNGLDFEDLINVSGESRMGVDDGERYNFKWFDSRSIRGCNSKSGGFYAAVDGASDFLVESFR